ncbi:MAG: hypothetical protein J1F64_01975 [Oscillospiraceae bacterium]|nr:hypothetical protein [Oscillospiraceae bacterium]
MNGNENNNNENNNKNNGDITNSIPRSVELTLKSADDEEVVSIEWGKEFAKIFKRLKNKERLFLRIMCIFAIIGFCSGIYTPISRNIRSVNAAVSFRYDGIESGLAPDGSKLDISKIKSVNIVEKALNNSGISNVDAAEVSRRISIHGVIPQNIIDRIVVIDKIAETRPETAKELLDLEYNSTQYVLTFDFAPLKISGKKACLILNAVLEEYRKYFHDAYYDEQMLGTSVNVLDYSTYDFDEALDILEEQSDMVIAYLNKMTAETKDFRSPSTQLRYSDIKSAVNILKDIDIAKIYSTVYTYNISVDRNKMIKYYEYLAEQETRTLNEAVKRKEAIQSAIDNYQKDPIVIAGSEEQSAQLSSLSVAGDIYDSLIDRNIDAAAEIASVSKEIERYNERIQTINRLQSQNVNISEEDYEAAEAEAEAGIKETAEKLSGYIDSIGIITREYYESENYNDAYRISAPASYSGISITNVAINGAVSAVLGAVAGFVIMLLYQTAAVYIPFDVFFTERSGNDKSNKNKKK